VAWVPKRAVKLGPNAVRQLKVAERARLRAAMSAALGSAYVALAPEDIDPRRAVFDNVYHVNLAGVASLRDYFDALWEKALSNYKVVAEDLYRKKRKEKN
jgi:hypothetical protein